MPLIDSLFSIFAPHDCLVCDAEGALVCNWCASEAFPELPSRCYNCKQLSSDYAVCESCRPATGLRHVWVRTEYDNTAKELMRHFKYQRTHSAKGIIATAMDEILPYFNAETVVVPVPTATSRVRQRGYDQADLLARRIARQHGLMSGRVVTRLTQSRQVGANRKQRRTQLQDAFMVTKPDLIKKAEILLVDDVITTGATLEAMALVLKQAGAKLVNAVVFAQKQ